MVLQIFDHMEECTAEAVEQLLPLVPEWRQEQALRFRHVFGRFCCLKSWVMLQEIIRHNLAHSEDISRWQVETTEAGKPYFAEHPEVQFSISHCKEGIAVAVDSHPIGIDIESPTRKPLFQPENGMEFVEWWTRMEAIVKMRGTGITHDWKETCCRDDETVETCCPPGKKYVYSVAKVKKPA